MMLPLLYSLFSACSEERGRNNFPSPASGHECPGKKLRKDKEVERIPPLQGVLSAPSCRDLIAESRRATAVVTYTPGAYSLDSADEPRYDVFDTFSSGESVMGIVKSEVRQSHSIFLRMFFENIQPVTRHYGAPWGAY
ncbi:MAG: hypothetical protein GY820_22615 [Gammaproteobacteria bacterium]|nr:hypothetical protein [Gammaproteobacteria bacterium]